MNPRKWILIFGAALMLMALAACTGLLTYDPLDASLKDPVRDVPAGGLFSEMAADQDRVISSLGQALAGLPDFHDGLTDQEMEAVRLIEKWARQAKGRTRDLLADISARRAEGPRYSAALQGLLWMAEDGRLEPDTLKGMNEKSLIAYGFSRLPHRFDTPQKVLDYLTGNYSYVLDRDGSQSLYQFFVSKHGDCNEFSLMAGFLLEKQGLAVQIVHMKPSIWGRHVAVIFKQADGYYLMDASRAAILRVLEQREKREPLEPVDLQVRDLIRGFDRIHGPVQNPKDLVGLYNGGRPDHMEYRLQRFDAYRRAVGG